MLASFPSIEVLLLNFTHDDQNSYSGHEVKLELPPPCTLYNLKNVAARGIEGFECEHDFFAYLSDSGANLERIVMMENGHAMKHRLIQDSGKNYKYIKKKIDEVLLQLKSVENL
ncbi:hypothetical protein Syun_027240 [Stephania yunnanensis]|uniref:FBD domain-containing protein n=1 Tax=Stephania yunnanensis TaxID=152371 RepID=A0AAP0EFL0_9MAGN